MNIGTIIYTWFFGKKVGVDEFKNIYYCNSKNFEDLNSKRWVLFSDEIEASKYLLEKYYNAKHLNRRLKWSNKNSEIISSVKIKEKTYKFSSNFLLCFLNRLNLVSFKTVKINALFILLLILKFPKAKPREIRTIGSARLTKILREFSM